MNKLHTSNLKNILLILAIFGLTTASLFSQNTNNLCLGANPFCTDENPYGVTYPAGTDGEDCPDLDYDSYGCLGSTPAPAWYVMQIRDPGDMLIYLYHDRGEDIDFACWGPFTGYGSYSQVLQAVCTSQLHGRGTSHRPTNGNHNGNMGGYPDETLIDCSYTSYDTEWCFIPNAQPGQWYLFLICNYSEEPGNIHFEVQSGNATTDCSITAPLADAVACEGETVTLTAQAPANAVHLQWTGPNNFSQTTTGNTLTLTNVTTAQAGTYTVRVWNGTAYGSPSTCQLVVHPMPHLTIAPAEICNGESATLTVSGAETYQWSTNSTSATITVTPNATTTYTVTGTNGGMCTATASATVTVHPVYNLTFNETICQGEEYDGHGVTLSAIETNEPGDYTFTNHYQSVHGCDSAITLNLTILPASVTNIEATICQGESYPFGGQNLTAAGVYTDRVNNGGNCDDVTILTLHVNPVYNIESRLAICETDLPYYYAAEDTTFEAGTATGTHTFRYTTVNGCDSLRTLRLTVNRTYETDKELVLCTSQLPYHLPQLGMTFDENTPTESDHVAHLTSVAGCDSTVNLHVSIINDALTLENLTPDLCDENRAVLHVETELPNIEWSTGERNTADIVITRGGLYDVSAHTEGCSNSARIYIEPCQLGVYLPNAISSTLDDGINDVFCLPDATANLMLQEDFEIIILNRWGTLVYRSEDPHFRWDGCSNGKKAANNVFSYKMTYRDINGQKFVKKGWVTVL